MNRNWTGDMASASVSLIPVPRDRLVCLQTIEKVEDDGGMLRLEGINE
jgi:hypothetical protein